MNPFLQVREKVNLFLYNNKNSTLNILRVLSVVFSVIGLALMVYYYGFPLSYGDEELIITLFKGLFAYYIFSYLIRVVYSFEVRGFLKETWYEGGLLLLLLVDAFGYYFFGQTWLEDFIGWLGFVNYHEVYGVILQVYLLMLIVLEFGKFDLDLSKIRINPALLFMLLFGVLIFIGAGLLMLPEMTVDKIENGEKIATNMPFVDALFTSASATCVTGLMVESAAEYFTFKGQLVLLALFKIGGINIVAFGIFITFFARFGLRVKQHDILEDILNKDNELGAKGLFGKILLVSLVIEAIGAILIFALLPNHPEITKLSDKLFYAIFHSVSAFNNAGISLFSDGMATAGIATAYPLIVVFTCLIFLGSLGFLAILDLMDIKQLKERIKKPWKKMDLGSRIAIIGGVHLLVFGTLIFMFFQYNSTMLSEMNFFEKIITATFQVINRTSGFSSVDFNDLAIPVILIFLVLMFIGGASSSTAGGIKTSTFTILVVSVKSIIKGKKHVELFGKNISNDLVQKAFVVFLFATLNIFLGTFLLCITESDHLLSGKFTFIQLVFEEFSAFSTVGLSMGITSDLTTAGRIVLVINMFVGRIGTLMVLLAISKKSLSTNYKYPDAHVMIG